MIKDVLFLLAMLGVVFWARESERQKEELASELKHTQIVNDSLYRAQAQLIIEHYSECAFVSVKDLRDGRIKLRAY